MTTEHPHKLAPRSGDVELDVEQLLALPLFDDLSSRVEARLQGKAGRGALVLRRFRAGEPICHQGDPGWTAFYIVKAEDLAKLGVPPLADAPRACGEGAAGDEARVAATVSLEIGGRPRAEAPRGGGLLGLARRLFPSGRAAKGVPAGQGTSAARRSEVPFDGPLDLELRRPVGVLHEGELFGEASCLNQAPRSATVTATREIYVLELLASVLDLLLSSPTFRGEMDAIYRRRALGGHLRNISIFASAPDEVLALVRERAELLRRGAGEIIFEEGEPSDSLYVIRTGTVRVQSAGGRVLAYRSRGEVVGEMGLLAGAPRSATCLAYEHPRDESKARGRRRPPAGRVELVKIDRALFDEVCARFPAFRAAAQEIAQARRVAEAERARAQPHLPGRLDALGLAQGQKLLLIDLERCTRCDDCVRACADVHDDETPRLRREGPRFGKYLVPGSCRQCADPVCLIGCPVAAIHPGASGEIVVEDWCIGCGVCAEQCPYDAIALHGPGEGDAARKALVCDQCAPLPDATPRCVSSCPHEAAIRVDASVFFAQRGA